MGPITDLSWSFSHYFLLSSSLDQTARLWNISNSQCLCVSYNL
jgi:WD40 repeat protein